MRSSAPHRRATAPGDGTSACRAGGPAEIRFRRVTAGFQDRAERGGRGSRSHRFAGSPRGDLGPTGAGKSTILNLLLRFVDRARAALGRRATARSIDPERGGRRSRGCRSPRTWSTGPSPRTSGSHGPPRPTTSCWRRSRDAAAGPFIDELPAGFDTVIGPGGHGLSGGQVRRLAIARALVADRPVVLLDEPTADLDPVSADHVAATLERLRGRRSVVFATHDPRLMRLADDVLVLDRGRVVSTGSPRDKLLQDALAASDGRRPDRTRRCEPADAMTPRAAARPPDAGQPRRRDVRARPGAAISVGCSACSDRSGDGSRSRRG